MSKVIRTFVLLTMFIVLIGLPERASALSCNVRILLILKCESGKCERGFFVGEENLGDWCRQTFDTTLAEPIIDFDGDLSRFSEVPAHLNGIYSIETTGHYAFTNRADRYIGLYQTDSSGKISYRPKGCCDNTPVIGPKLEKLSYPDDTKLESVISDFATRAENDRFWFMLEGFTFPLLLLAVFGSALSKFGRRHTGKYIFAFLGLSIPMISIWGRRSWILTALISLVLTIVWTVLFFVRRMREKRVNTKADSLENV